MPNKQFISKPLDDQGVHDLQNNSLILHDYFEQSQASAFYNTDLPIPADSTCRNTNSPHNPVNSTMFTHPLIDVTQPKRKRVYQKKGERRNRIKKVLHCKNDRLFEEAKRTNKKFVPFGSKFTIEDSRKYFQCIDKGRKICPKNQEIVDQAMANNQRVRSNYGRYLTIVGEEVYFDRKEANLKNTHLCREKQNKKQKHENDGF